MGGWVGGKGMGGWVGVKGMGGWVGVKGMGGWVGGWVGWGGGGCPIGSPLIVVHWLLGLYGPARRDGSVCRVPGTGRPGAGGQDLDARILEQVGVDAVEAGDLLVLVGDEARPVEALALEVPAVGGGVVHVVRVVGAVHHELLGDAAHVDAGAAEAAEAAVGRVAAPGHLGERHLGAVGGGDARGANAAAAAADDEVVVFVAVRGRHFNGRSGEASRTGREDSMLPG